MNEATPVFILHWNNPDGCARTVREFQKQRVPVKITVLDNGSREENIKRLEHVVGNCVEVVRLEKNLGFGSGLNEGLRVWLSEKNGNYVVVSAHDAIPHEDCVARLLKTMEDHTDAGIISPEYDTDMVTRFSGLRGPYLERTSEPSAGGFEPQAFANGVVMMFRRRCLEEVGIFDKRYFAYGDEVDLCLRAWEQGWKVGFVRGVRVENPGCSVPSELASYLQVRNSILLVRKWKGWHWAALRSLIFALNAFRFLFRKSERPHIFSPRAWVKGIVDAWLGRHFIPHANDLNQQGIGRGAEDKIGAGGMEYKGLVQKIGVPGLHEAVLKTLKPFLFPDAKVLDCGSGSGAFALRLKDMGYYVEAIELDQGFFHPEDIRCYNLNLNDDFSSSVKNKFDIITAVEVIEHLENPRHFLRECHKLLDARGKVIITTPNIDSVPARLKFLLKGRLRGFEFDFYKDPKHHESEHITPIFSTLLMRIAEDTGFDVIGHTVFPENGFSNSRRAFSVISRLVAPFLRGNKYGETNIFLLEKA